jgi:hypothetical protein
MSYISFGLSAKATSESISRCKKSLATQTQSDSGRSLLRLGDDALIIDELVSLTLSQLGTERERSPWWQINVGDELSVKTAEIERKLGKDKALQIFNEVRTRVMKQFSNGVDAPNGEFRRV